MNLLLKGATIIDPESQHDGNEVDVLIEDGKIAAIEPTIETDAATIVSSENLHVSPGWIDLQARFCDPGFEFKEDVFSGLDSAASGGYTGVAVLGDTNPVVDSKAGVEYLLNKASQHPVTLFPIACLSAGRRGVDLAELFDMHQSGAVAFSDGHKAVASAELMKRALQYVQPFGGLVMSFPSDPTVAGGGQLHEGPVSTQLGLKGMPALAEELMVERDIALLEYTGGKLHFATVSTARSIERIAAAQAKGLNVSASVAVANLLFCDEDTVLFDTNLKVLPPLRSQSDVDALWAGLKSGVLSSIISDHTPEDIEHKKLEFDRASFGMNTLQTVYSSLNAAGKLSTSEIVQQLAIGPRKLLDMPADTIAVNHEANLTLFDPTIAWSPAPDNWESRSRNTPFWGKDLIGRCVGIVNKGKYRLV